MRHRLAVIVVSAALACSVGTKAKNFPPAREPAGATVQIRYGRASLRLAGELLAVQEEGLLGRTGDRVWLAPNPLLRRGEVATRGMRASFSGRLRGSTRERFRLLSRFPQGVTPDVLQQVLAAYGQDSVQVLHE